MTERLIVKNFVGIKDLEIEVKKINVLIGPQASGKSICAKLLFYFKNFPWEILSAVENEETKRNFDSNCSKRFIKWFPPISWGNESFFIRYEINDVFIEVKRITTNKSRISIDYADSYKKEFLLLHKMKKRTKEEAEKYKDIRHEQLNYYLIREHLSNYLTSSLCNEASFIQLFVPAGRAFLANLQNNIFSFLHSNNDLDPFLEAFGSEYESLKGLVGIEIVNMQASEKEKYLEKKYLQDSRISLIVEEILCGKHINLKGKDYIENADHRLVSLVNASSGQQETLPLLIILAKLPIVVEFFLGRTVYIEEPEAHLFPQAQKSIIDLIATVFNYHEDKLQFFITTHSPYTLTSFNNLLQAGMLYKELDTEHLEELEKIVPRYKALSTDDFSAYALADGKCTSIIDPETGLIDATIIDTVSEDLAFEFDNLLNLV